MFLAAFVILCFRNKELSEIQILPHGEKGDLEIEGPLVKVSVKFIERHELEAVKVDHLVETWSMIIVSFLGDLRIVTL